GEGEDAQLLPDPLVAAAAAGPRHRSQTAGSGTNATDSSSPATWAPVTSQRRSTGGRAIIRRVPPVVTARSSSSRTSSTGPLATPGRRSTSSNAESSDVPLPAVRFTCSSGAAGGPGGAAGSSSP